MILPWRRGVLSLNSDLFLAAAAKASAYHLDDHMKEIKCDQDDWCNVQGDHCPALRFPRNSIAKLLGNNILEEPSLIVVFPEILVYLMHLSVICDFSGSILNEDAE